MSKAILGTLSGLLKKITTKGPIVGTRDYLMGLDSIRDETKYQMKICSDVISALLLYDKLCLPQYNIIQILNAFGIEDTIKMLRTDSFEMVDDDGLEIVAEEQYSKQSETSTFRISGLAFLQPRSDTENSFSKLEEKLKSQAPTFAKDIDRLMVLASKNTLKVPYDDVHNLITEELRYDFNNHNLIRTLGLVSEDPDKIKKQDILKVLRLVNVNKGLIYGHKAHADDIILDGAAQHYLSLKMSPVYKNDVTVTPVNVFRQILTCKGLPDLGTLYYRKIINIDEILQLRDDIDGLLFRKWFRSIDYDPEVTIRTLINRIKPSTHGSVIKHLRWLYPNVIGIVSPIAGMASSFIESYIVQKILDGWHPSLFLDDHLKAEIDKKIEYFEKQQRIEEIKKKFPGIGRNDKCPCGSNKKFKKCCGR